MLQNIKTYLPNAMDNFFIEIRKHFQINWTLDKNDEKKL